MSPRMMPEGRISEIIRAAARIFARLGFRRAQMEDIAAEAGVSKATLYLYFPGKLQLFHYVLEHGVPDEGVAVSPDDVVLARDEEALLPHLAQELRRQSRLPSIDSAAGAPLEDVDLAAELQAILTEMWELFEAHRLQIVILEKSAHEFPELAAVYDEYARKRVFKQLESYLRLRMEQGAIRKLHSPELMARVITEPMAWLGWKQLDSRDGARFSRADALPDLVSTLAAGLEA
jgi:AcrR family transcriptional regulator